MPCGLLPFCIKKNRIKKSDVLKRPPENIKSIQTALTIFLEVNKI